MNNLIAANLLVWSNVLPGARITELLEVIPDTEIIRGVDRVPPRANPVNHGWCVRLESPEMVAPMELLEKLLSKVAPALDRLRQLRAADPNVEVFFNVTIRPPRFDTPLLMSSTTVALLAAWGAEFDIEFFEGD